MPEPTTQPSVHKPALVSPKPQARVRNVEDLLAIHHIPSVLQLRRIVLLLVLLQVAILVMHALDLLTRQATRAVPDREPSLARAMNQMRRRTQIRRQPRVFLHILERLRRAAVPKLPY